MISCWNKAFLVGWIIMWFTKMSSYQNFRKINWNRLYICKQHSREQLPHIYCACLCVCDHLLICSYIVLFLNCLYYNVWYSANASLKNKACTNTTFSAIFFSHQTIFLETYSITSNSNIYCSIASNTPKKTSVASIY